MDQEGLVFIYPVVIWYWMLYLWRLYTVVVGLRIKMMSKSETLNLTYILTENIIKKS